MAFEKKLDNDVQDYVKKRGGFAVKIHGSEMQATMSDLVICYKGYFIALEDKGPKGVISDKQIGRIKQMRKAGGIAEVCFTIQLIKDICRTIDAGETWLPRGVYE